MPVEAVRTGDEVKKQIMMRRRKAKPISAGWKSLAWTKPGEEHMGRANNSRSGIKVVALTQQRLEAGPGLRPPGPTRPRLSRRGSTGSIVTVEPAEGMETTLSVASPENGVTNARQSMHTGSISSVSRAGNNSHHDEQAPPGNRSHDTTPLEHSDTLQSSSVSIPNSPTGEEEVSTRGSQHRATSYPSRTLLGSENLFEPEREGEQTSMPDMATVPGRGSRERALSDPSCSTVSDLVESLKADASSIFTEISEEGAIAVLSSLCSTGRGLPVVKHAGYGGSKARKILRYNKDGGVLVLTGIRPPFFKTKIPVTDVDRADVKWCCVVIHMKDRPLVSVVISTS